MNLFRYFAYNNRIFDSIIYFDYNDTIFDIEILKYISHLKITSI